MASISLCMIVNNEETNMRRCLESVSSIVDEIIIVDTGSSDLTKSICMEFGAKIIDHKWNNDFAVARNISIENATSDWILWLDADEQLVVDNKDLLDIMISNKNPIIFAIKMYHLFSDRTLENKDYYISHNYRLFPNRKGIHFTGSIHEKIVYEEGTLPVESTKAISLIHYGYQHDNTNKKMIRNLNLLAIEKEKGNKDPWIDYHIAAELFLINDMEKAFLFVNRSIAGFLVDGLVPPALVYKLKYELLIYSNSIENAYQGIKKAVELYPDYVELHFYRGILLYRQKKYADAIQAFQLCIVLGEDNINYLIMAGTGSFLAYEYIGDCYVSLNQPNFALEAYQQSLLKHPDFESVKEKLKDLEKQMLN